MVTEMHGVVLQVRMFRPVLGFFSVVTQSLILPTPKGIYLICNTILAFLY